MKNNIIDTEILCNGNIYITIEGFAIIEVIDVHKYYSAEKLSEIIVSALNEYSCCKNCNTLTKTKNELCDECNVQANPITKEPELPNRTFQN